MMAGDDPGTAWEIAAPEGMDRPPLSVSTSHQHRPSHFREKNEGGEISRGESTDQEL